ncbi:hypothetical protein BB561_001647 [Smittium simulii]|uniref:RING-type domain-containing protein n=1 Tax=Smittium simulii TaxID=133385 RepID=A0A2T9YTP6_9FUNG|nr:hypothetical protein BB561_001647 [Smittium simulii]
MDQSPEQIYDSSKKLLSQDIIGYNNSTLLTMNTGHNFIQNIIKEKRGYNTVSNTNDGVNPYCGICLKLVLPSDHIRDLPCSHIFHKECLENYVALASEICPICRFELISQNNLNGSISDTLSGSDTVNPIRTNSAKFNYLNKNISAAFENQPEEYGYDLSTIRRCGSDSTKCTNNIQSNQKLSNGKIRKNTNMVIAEALKSNKRSVDYFDKTELTQENKAFIYKETGSASTLRYAVADSQLLQKSPESSEYATPEK